MIQLDFNSVYLGEMVVFVVASAFKSVILKLDVVKSTFLNIFIQDSRQTKIWQVNSWMKTHATSNIQS